MLSQFADICMLSLYLFIFIFLNNINNGLFILIISELIWVGFFSLYVVNCFLFDSIVFGGISIILLILASVDCGI